MGCEWGCNLIAIGLSYRPLERGVEHDTERAEGGAREAVRREVLPRRLRRRDDAQYSSQSIIQYSSSIYSSW
jgi:hypothetical protein